MQPVGRCPLRHHGRIYISRLRDREVGGSVGHQLTSSELFPNARANAKHDEQQRRRAEQA